MRLLINGLSARLGGGQTYLYQLLHHLPAEWDITLLSSGRLDAARIPGHIRHVIKPALINPFRRTWWERTQLETFATAKQCEVVFNPACLLPPLKSSRIKTAVTFQNMLPFDAAQRRAYPLFSYRRLRDMLLEHGLLSAMKRADLVIFISQFAQQFMLQQKQVHPPRATVITHGVEEQFFTSTILPDDSPLAGKPYFLYVSFLDFYKCQRETLQAYATLKMQHKVTEKLVFIGAGYVRYEALLRQDIAALNLKHDVLLLGNVPHEALPALYQHATLNLFASTCENCPNILMEIMASGAPALVSNHGPMPEIAGDTVTYFDPRNHQNFVQAWADVLRNLDAAKANATRAVERAKNYRWKDAMAATAQALESLVRAT